MSYENILQSSSQFQLVQKERQIATWLRGYKVPKLSERYSVENVGLRVLVDLATLSTSDLFEIDGRHDAIVNALGRTLGNSYRQDAHYSTSYFASLAALTFASAGNFASAKVLASSALQSSDLGTVERWMMEILANRRIELSRISTPPILIPYAQLTDHALTSGEDFNRATIEFLRANKEDCEALTSSDRGLLLLWETVHTRFQELSVAKVLRDIEFPNQNYARELLKSSSLFYPSQVYTLRNYPLTRRGKSVFIALPTSTGKSLLGEISLIASLTWQPGERWLAVYVAPYRALTTQIMGNMRKRLRSADIACDMRRGGYLSEEPLRPGYPTIIIATPEAFDGLLRRTPELYRSLAGCVFDEFHLIEQQQRGICYEGLIGRFLRGAAGEGWPKIVALSAVVEDTEPIEQWLQTDAIIRNDWKPTSRRIAIARENKTIEYYTPDELLPGDTEAQIGWQERLPISAVNVAKVALDQFRRFGGEPVLIVANRRSSTRDIALNLRYALADKPLPEEATARRKAEEIIRLYPYLYTLYDCLQYGIAYHNAALPNWVRVELEELLDGKHLRFIVSTTTLAEGVDFPFRVVILEDWSQLYQFGQEQPISRLMVRNIAGRGGRAWAYTEGDTILIEKATNTTAFEQYIAPASYRLQSSIHRALETDNKHRLDILQDSWAVAESQFVAFLSACHDQGNIEEDFTGSLYAGLDRQTGQHITSVTRDMVEHATKATRPVMQKQSPLTLTDFGETVLKTGLSPRSGIALADFLETCRPPNIPPAGNRRRERYGIEWVPLVAAIWQSLQQQSGTWIRELQTSDFRRIGKQRFPVRKVDFNEVVMAWMSGVPMEVIGYLTLRSSRNISKGEVRLWLEAERHFPPRDFEGWIDRLSGFCWDYLSRQWSWVFRGGMEICNYLAEEASRSQSDDLTLCYHELGSEFDKLALRLEFGVSDTEVAEWLQQRCPVDRAKLDALKREYSTSRSKYPLLPHSTFYEWLQSERERLIGLQVGPFPVFKVLEDDLNRLERFLSKREGG